MTTGHQIRLSRRYLYRKQKGRCYWCDKKMQHIFRIPSGYRHPLLCTIDHLDSRLNPDRGKFGNHKQWRRVAACQKCNHEHARFEELSLSKEELNRRSKRHPNGKNQSLQRVEAPQSSDVAPDQEQVARGSMDGGLVRALFYMDPGRGNQEQS